MVFKAYTNICLLPHSKKFHNDPEWVVISELIAQSPTAGNLIEKSRDNKPFLYFYQFSQSRNTRYFSTNS